jgi:UDP-N-acetylenolpyruvoylglucosamine reductase
MQEKFKILVQALGKERIKFDEPLKYHLANPTEALAECFYIATTIKELEEVLNLANELKIPFFLLGSGTKVFFADEGLTGLIIKNRTSGIKISGVKGKVSVKGIGVEEAMVEAESGVSIKKLNDFLQEQKLRLFNFPFIPNSTIGGSLYVTPPLSDTVQKIKVWSEGEISDIDTLELKRGDIVLSVIFKVKAAA